METHLVGRNLSCDYLLFVPAVAIAFNLFLLAGKRWKELIIFNICGSINLGAELLMLNSGMRTFDSDSFSQRAAAMLCLGWVTNGFVCTLAYMNIRQWLKQPYPSKAIVISNVIYFVILPLAMFDRSVFDCSITTVREMKDLITYIEPVLLALFASIIYLLGYRQLLWRLLIIGFFLDLGFEGSLFISGVRPEDSFNIVKVGGRVLFEMNTMFCVGFLIFKAIFGLKDYRDTELQKADAGIPE